MLIRNEEEPALVFLVFIVLLVLGAGRGLVLKWVGEKSKVENKFQEGEGEKS